MTSVESIRDDSGRAPDVAWSVETRRSWSGFASFARRHPGGTLGLLLISVFAVLAALGGQLAPYGKDDIFKTRNPFYDPNSVEAKALSETQVSILATPSWDHPLGTDSLGRDLFSRVFDAARP